MRVQGSNGVHEPNDPSRKVQGSRGFKWGSWPRVQEGSFIPLYKGVNLNPDLNSTGVKNKMNPHK